MEIDAGRAEQSGGRKWGGPLNKRLRSLIQKLGEAIHETVSESEDIASVVQDIRKQGFDVLLMLEATIGLNEVEQQPKQLTANATSGESEAGVVDSATGFTTQDVNFLRSLRIAVECEAGNSAGDASGN
jgi:uncharacterized protein (UPF0335 family)